MITDGTIKEYVLTSGPATTPSTRATGVLEWFRMKYADVVPPVSMVVTFLKGEIVNPPQRENKDKKK